MGTINFLKLAAATLVLTLSTIVVAGPGQNNGLHGALCANGNCNNNLSLSGPAQLKDLLVKVNTFGHNVHVQPVQNDTTFAPVGLLTVVNVDAAGKPVAGVKSTGEPSFVHSQATAFLVSPCHILTNYHAVYGDNAEILPKSQRLLFSVGDQGGAEHLPYNVEATPVTSGHYFTTKYDGDDWALLELKACVGSQSNIGWMKLSHSSPQSVFAKKFAMVSRPENIKSSELEFDFSCHIYEAEGSGRSVNHDCSDHKRSSGGAIFEPSSTDFPVVYGLNRGPAHEADKDLAKFDPFFANHAILVSTFYPLIEERINEAIAKYPTNGAVVAFNRNKNVQVASNTTPAL